MNYLLDKNGIIVAKGLRGEELDGKLTELLHRIADAQGLTPGVHPGYQRLGKPKPTDFKQS